MRQQAKKVKRMPDEIQRKQPPPKEDKMNRIYRMKMCLHNTPRLPGLQTPSIL
jgi:hypothetical protein